MTLILAVVLGHQTFYVDGQRSYQITRLQVISGDISAQGTTGDLTMDRKRIPGGHISLWLHGGAGENGEKSLVRINLPLEGSFENNWGDSLEKWLVSLEIKTTRL